MKTTKMIALYSVIVFNISFLSADNLTSKYQQMMSKTTSVSTTNSPQETEKNASIKPDKVEYNLIDEIKKVQALKQDTFESSSDFNLKREQALNELRNKVKFFSKNSSEEYSAGAVSMKSYDADREVMQLTPRWNSDLRSVFPEIKNLQTLFLNIDKHNARALFEKQKKHYFHIDMKYTNSKLTISEMSIYNKYKMFKQKSNKASNKTSSGNSIDQKEVARLRREKEAMALELQRLKRKKTVQSAQQSFQAKTDHTLTQSQNNSSRKRKSYTYVCYDEKFLTRGKAIYNGCVRKASSCKRSGKHHFGKYPNDQKAHEAFIRCISSNPKFVDYQGL